MFNLRGAASRQSIDKAGHPWYVCRILEETKDVTEWVNSFVIVEKLLIDSSNSHSPGHSMNKKLFTRIWKFPGLPYKFQLKPNAKLTRHAPRKVLIHLQESFHEEIRNLEALGILEETKGVTEWVNSFVIVEKKLPIDSSNSHSQGHSMNKKLQICLDPRNLNEVLEQEPYYTCSTEEIIGKVHGMTKFMIAEFNKGYWMVELDPELRKYTTMALDIRRFQWTRLPMGSIVAQDVFQRKLDVIFLSIPGVTGLADMIIYGRNDQEHDEHLVNFLEVCRKNTLTLNPDKMQFRLPQVSSLDTNGVQGASILIQRKLQQWNIWNFHRIWKQWGVSLDLLIISTDSVPI